MKKEKADFSKKAQAELQLFSAAMNEILSLTFEVFENAGLDNITLDDYKGYVLEANSKYSPKEDNSFDGLTVLRYESYIEAKKTNFTYFVSLYKGTDAFWIVQFACKSSEYADYEQYFVKWARSVRV